MQANGIVCRENTSICRMHAEWRVRGPTMVFSQFIFLLERNSSAFQFFTIDFGINWTEWIVSVTHTWIEPLVYLQTPCCGKFYKCRYCHDENEDHHFDRKTLTELICTKCDTRQKVQAECENCGVRFGKVSLAATPPISHPLSGRNTTFSFSILTQSPVHMSDLQSLRRWR